MDPLIWTKNGCGANAVIKLLKNNDMDFTQREPFQNRTILHFWAGTPYNEYNSHQEDSLAVVKLLVEKGADLLALDSCGFTPLLEASNGRCGERPNLEVLDYLLEREEYSRAEKIEAMELAVAAIIAILKNASNFHIAFDYWRKALKLRQMDDVEGSGLIQKTRLNLKSVRTAEWITSAELEDVIDHPETYMIQSFLVRLRIFFYKSWKAIESLFQSNYRHSFLSELMQQRRFVEIFDIIWAILETLSHFDPLEKCWLQRRTDEVIGKLIWMFAWIEQNSTDLWSREIINTSLDLIVSVTVLHRVDLHELIQLVRILFRLPYPTASNIKESWFGDLI